MAVPTVFRPSVIVTSALASPEPWIVGLLVMLSVEEEPESENSDIVTCGAATKRRSSTTTVEVVNERLCQLSENEWPSAPTEIAELLRPTILLTGSMLIPLNETASSLIVKPLNDA